MNAPTKTNALRQQGKGEKQNVLNNAILPQSQESIKSMLRADFMDGKDIRLIDYPEDQRIYVIGAIAELRDELPIRMSWQTIRESHLSETRLRAKRYSISGEFIRAENLLNKGVK